MFIVQRDVDVNRQLDPVRDVRKVFHTRETEEDEVVHRRTDGGQRESWVGVTAVCDYVTVENFLIWQGEAVGLVGILASLNFQKIF